MLIKRVTLPYISMGKSKLWKINRTVSLYLCGLPSWCLGLSGAKFRCLATRLQVHVTTLSQHFNSNIIIVHANSYIYIHVCVETKTTATYCGTGVIHFAGTCTCASVLVVNTLLKLLPCTHKGKAICLFVCRLSAQICQTCTWRFMASEWSVA